MTSNASTAISSNHHAGSASVGIGSFLTSGSTHHAGLLSNVSAQPDGSQHTNMMTAAAARRGNHRRTKSTHPDELNKMMLTFNKDSV